jgi:hypothetical protein
LTGRGVENGFPPGRRPSGREAGIRIDVPERQKFHICFSGHVNGRKIRKAISF